MVGAAGVATMEVATTEEAASEGEAAIGRQDNSAALAARLRADLTAVVDGWKATNGLGVPIDILSATWGGIDHDLWTAAILGQHFAYMTIGGTQYLTRSTPAELESPTVAPAASGVQPGLDPSTSAWV